MRLLEDLRDISAVLARAAPPVDAELERLILALEDKRFWRHPGVDVIAAARALSSYAAGHARGGASTIDMQLVRTLTGRRERTPRRKIREILLALIIRRRFGATRILGCYLSLAYCGTHATGIPAASAMLFARSVADCGVRQKAVLAALLLCPIPSRRGFRWWRRVVRRARIAGARVERLQD